MASRKQRSTSPSPLLRSSSPSNPSFHRPLTINVDMIQPTTTGILHPRGSTVPMSLVGTLPLKKLSKRSSFDSGINLAAAQQQMGSRKDAKTLPKYVTAINY